MKRLRLALVLSCVPPLGVRKNITVTTSQLAATIAASVGQGFRAAVPKIAAPLPLR